MTMIVVDTNVAIVANGGEATNVDMKCQLSCTERLEVAVKGEVVVLDDAQEILTEYARHLSFSGKPGVGDVFFKHVFDNQYQDGRVQLVTISKCQDVNRGYKELPRNNFDRSDRKIFGRCISFRRSSPKCHR